MPQPRPRGGRVAARTHARTVGRGEVLMMLWALYMQGGAVALSVVVFLLSGSLWALLLMVPWFVMAKFYSNMR